MGSNITTPTPSIASERRGVALSTIWRGKLTDEQCDGDDGGVQANNTKAEAAQRQIGQQIVVVGFVDAVKNHTRNG